MCLAVNHMEAAMTTSGRTKNSGFDPQSFWQMGNPFLAPYMAMMQDGEAPNLAMQPMKAVARSQLEAMQLVNRRMQACMEMPSRLAACRSPQDLFTEQMRFFQVAMQDYAQAANQMAQLWGQAFVAPQETTANTEPSHDYLDLPSPSQTKKRKASKSGSGTSPGSNSHAA